MDLEIIQTLSESAIFRSSDYLDKFTDEQNANLLYLYLLSVHVIATEDHENIIKYISRTTVFNTYNYFRPSGTDLYMLLHLQKNNRYFNIAKLNTYLLALLHHRPVQAYRFFADLEIQLKIKRPEVIRIKRSVVTWDSLLVDNKSEIIYDLMREIRRISVVAEILQPLGKLNVRVNEFTLTERTVTVPVSTIKDIARQLGMVDTTEHDEDHDAKVLAALDDYFKTLNDGQYSPFSGENNNASSSTEVYQIAKKHGVDPTYLMKYLSDVAIFDKFQKLASTTDIGENLNER